MDNPIHQGSQRTLSLSSGELRYFSLPALESAGAGAISRLPHCVRVLLESVLRNVDGGKVTEEHVRQLASWQAAGPRQYEIPFVVGRIVLQDYTGVPLLADLAAMREEAQRRGQDPARIEPQVPVTLVIDHSVQTEHTREPDAVALNIGREYARNGERYKFMKWGAQAFESLQVVPPGVGIVHQVNLEHLSRGVWVRDGVAYFDTVIGTDSHTTMVNGIGVLGWGAGGIEAEAGMLGQPVYILTPDVVGVHLHGALREGVTATDLALALTQMLRKANVVGKFVEYHGSGARGLCAADRATIANMAPDYGATVGYFGVDDETLRYLENTGRSPAALELVRAYFTAQDMFGIPDQGAVDYTTVLDFDLGSVVPCVSGPRRPQERIALPDLKTSFGHVLKAPIQEGGYGVDSCDKRVGLDGVDGTVGHGDILIAGITSCTNTSNPGVLLAAGILAKKARARGLKVPARIKASLAPGSRSVATYLREAGLLTALEEVGFPIAAYGCTTCIGNVGNLVPELEEAVRVEGIVAAAVLSGNRNFEARIHPSVKANFLMSPPLVVAFALAGNVHVDLTTEHLGRDPEGYPVYLRDIWPTQAEIQALMQHAERVEAYLEAYADMAGEGTPWTGLDSNQGPIYAWDPSSTYVAEPPFCRGELQGQAPPGVVRAARALLILGDSITTDHISPAGRIPMESEAANYLRAHGVEPHAFNTFGARRGHHEVMVRGTFANVRLKNHMMYDGREGGWTVAQPSGEAMSIFAAAESYRRAGTAAIIVAGSEYGTGSSRDWAAKGTKLLGVRAVVARSFERIHRSNLVGMGVLPCQFLGDDGAFTLGLTGQEVFDLEPECEALTPGLHASLTITRADGSSVKVRVLMRLDTPTEVVYFQHGGIIPYMLASSGEGADSHVGV